MVTKRLQILFSVLIAVGILCSFFCFQIKSIQFCIQSCMGQYELCDYFTDNIVTKTNALPLFEEQDRLKFVSAKKYDSYKYANIKDKLPSKRLIVNVKNNDISKQFILNENTPIVSAMPDFEIETQKRFLNIVANVQNFGKVAAVMAVYPDSLNEIYKFFESFENQPQDARIVKSERGFKIFAQSDGMIVDREKFLIEMYDGIMSSSSNGSVILLGRNEVNNEDLLLGGADFTVVSKLVVAKPTVYAKDLVGEIKYRNSYTTSIEHSSDNRKSNVALAISKFDGMTVGVGQTVSFNETVGERTEANGFLNAKVIANGKYVDGVGGGVCQASTTLYNALILSGLKIIKVCRHTLIPSYVPPSRDAMVNAVGADLIFQNTTDKPIHIRTFATERIVCVVVFGDTKKESFAIESEVIETVPRGEPNVTTDEGQFVEKIGDRVLYDDELVLLSYGHDGLKSRSFLITTNEFGISNKSLMRQDVYQPLKDEYVRGKVKRS